MSAVSQKQPRTSNGYFSEKDVYKDMATSTPAILGATLALLATIFRASRRHFIRLQ